MLNPTPARRPRRWWKVLAALAVVALALAAALPWLLSTGPARSRVAAGLNRALAPGRLEFEELQVSWFGPTRLTRVSLLDPRGEPVAKVPAATLDRTLGQLLLGSRGPAILTLDGASLEVGRAAEGSVNLAEALRAVIATPDPNRDLTIRIANGSLRYRDPFLAEPATADSLDVTIRVPYAPGPVTWLAKLGHGDASLEVRGDFDTWLSRGGPALTPELEVGVVGKRWPFVARTAGLDATGRLDGTLDFVRKRGRWVLSGDARVTGLNARGKGFSGDTLAFDRLEAGWDLAEGEQGWTIRRLSADSPLGRLKAEGQLNGPDGAGKQRVEGKINLAEIARQLPHALHLRDGLVVDRGTARIAVDLASDPGQSSYDIEANVSDLAARDHDRPLNLNDPATFTARLVRRGDDSNVERLSVKTSFLEASARGRLEEGVDLEGTIDLGRFRKQLGDWVALDQLDLAGLAKVSGTYRLRPAGGADRPSHRFENTLGATIRDLRVEGFGHWAVRRDRVTLETSVDGLAEATGFPKGWDRVVAKIGSGDSSVQVDLKSKGDAVGVTGAARVPLASAAHPDRYVSATMDGDWTAGGQVLTIGRADLSVILPGPEQSGARLEAIAKGRFDRSSGELALDFLPGDSPLAITPGVDGIRVSGLGKGLGSLRGDGGLSGHLEGLDELLSDLAGRPPLGLSGRWSAIGNARGDADGVQFAARFGLVEPTGSPSNSSRPTSLALRARYSPSSDRLDLSEFTVASAYGTLDASGTLEDATGDRRVDLRGTLAPDFPAINALLASKVEPGARVEGKPRAFRASGPLAGGGTPAWRGLDAEFGFDLAGADIYGMKFGPSPVVLRARRGTLAFDPISTTLNEGHVRLEPEVDLDAPGGPTLRLAKNSAIREARINDEVSKRVLAYVAPVLDQATRARGLVSVDLDHAEFPIGPGRGRQAKVEGAVVFQDVEFAPGPLAGEILGAIGRRDLSLKLDQPVTLTIADGRVNQRGMTIPVGDLTRIELAGWVDFDRNLALVATVPVTPAMLGNNPLLSDIAAGTKVRLPIGGTLGKPMIDKEAFGDNLQELGKSLLARGATRGAMELLMRLSRPKDPNAPPPPPRPSPEERKAMRQERKAIRRGEIPPPPVENPRP